jgi:hypothetical protein
MFDFILAGDTHKFNWSDSSYPSSTWTLQYSLIGPSTLHVDGAPQADGSFLLTLSSTATTTLKVGTYTWTVRMVQGAEKYTVDSGTAQVLPDPAYRMVRVNIAERMIELIELALTNQLSEGEAYESLSISGRSLTSINRKELLEERKLWKAELAAYRRAMSGQQEIESIRLDIGRL